MMYWNWKLWLVTLRMRRVQPIHMMYWNFTFCLIIWQPLFVQPIHMMYWNKSPLHLLQALYRFNRYIWCIEISVRCFGIDLLQLFNRYIWCIEITQQIFWKVYRWCSTDTYDVLKSELQNRQTQRACSSTDTYDVLKSSISFRSASIWLVQPIHMMYWNRASNRT